MIGNDITTGAPTDDRTLQEVLGVSANKCPSKYPRASPRHECALWTPHADAHLCKECGFEWTDDTPQPTTQGDN